MAIVVKRPRAELDLLDIWNFIADDSLDRADQFLDFLEDKFQKLAQNPGLGRFREELLPGLRSFPTGNYVIFYYGINNGIDIIRVLHGARDLKSMFE